MNEIIY